MNEKLQKIHSYLLSQNVKNLPVDYGGFEQMMQDPAKAQKVHSYLVSQSIKNVDPDFNKFSDYVGIAKKKGFWEGVGESGGVLQSLGVDLPQSLTPQPQSQSEQPITNQIEQPKTAKTLGEWVTGAFGVFDKKVADMFNGLDWMQTTANDAVNQIVLGKKNANELAKLRKEGALIPALNAPRPFKAISDAIEYTASGTKPLPQNVGGNIVSGAVGVVPDVLTTLFVPEIKAPQVMQKIGMPILSKFGVTLGAQGAIQGGRGAEGGTAMQKLTAPTLGAIEGYLNGAVFDKLGEMSNAIGGRIADKVIPKPLTVGGAINKALLQSGGSSLSNAVFFGSYSNLDEFLKTGKISPETFASNAGMGLVMGLREPAKLLWAKGLTTFAGADKQVLNNVIRNNATPEDLSNQAFEKVQNVEAGKSGDIEKDVVDASILARTAQLKAVIDEVIQNPGEVKKSISESELDKADKEALIDKVNEISAEHDRASVETKDITDKIKAIDEQLTDAKNNKSLSSVERDILTEQLNIKKEELKNKVIEKQSEISKEPFKVGKETFKSKGELFKWLDENGIDENGELNRSFFDYKEDEWPDAQTIKAVNEWTEQAKVKIRERKEKLQAIEDLKKSEESPAEDIGKIEKTGTANGRDQYTVVTPNKQKDNFSVPEGSPQEEVNIEAQKIVDRYNQTTGGTENAIKGGKTGEVISQESRTEAGDGQVQSLRVGDNEQNKESTGGEKQQVGFTTAEVQNRDYAILKEKLGEKKAHKYFDQVNRLFDPNKTTVVEYRTNGVVTKEGDKYIFHALSDMDMKNWRVGFKTDVTDQFTTNGTTEENVINIIPSNEGRFVSPRGQTVSYRILHYPDNKGARYVVELAGNIGGLKFKTEQEALDKLNELRETYKKKGYTDEIGESVKDATKRLAEIEKDVSQDGYTFTINADLDPDMTTVDVFDKEGRTIQTDELPKTIKDLHDEYTKIVHDTNTSTDEGINTETPPRIEKTEGPLTEQQKEAITDTQTEKPPEVPPTGDNALNQSEIGKEGESEYTLGVRALNSNKLDQDIKDGIAKEGINYEPRGRGIRSEEAQELIRLFGGEKGGLDKIEAMVYNTKNDIKPDTRTKLNVYLTQEYGLLKHNATDPAERDRLRDKMVSLYMFSMEQGTQAGQWTEAQKEWGAVFGNSPEMLSAVVQKKLNDRNKGFFESNKTAIDEAKKLLDEVLGSPEGKTRIEQEVNDAIAQIGTKNFGAESKKKIDDFFSGLLIDPKQQNLYGGLLGIPVAAWNGSVLAVKNAILLGVDIVTAIKKGTDYLDKWYKDEYAKGTIKSPDWDRTEYENHMKEKLSGLKKEVPSTEKKVKKPAKAKTPPTEEEVLNKLLDKMAGFATKKQLQKFVKEYFQEHREKGYIDDKRYKELLAKAMGMDYVSDKIQAQLTDASRTMGMAQKKIRDVIDAFEELGKKDPKSPEFKEAMKNLAKLKKEAERASFDAQKANMMIKQMLSDEPELLDKIGSLIQGNLMVPVSLLRNVYGNIFLLPARGTRFLIMNAADAVLDNAGRYADVLRSKIDKQKNPGLYRWANKLMPVQGRTVDLMGSMRGYGEGFLMGVKEGIKQLKTGQMEDDLTKIEVSRSLEPIKAAIRIYDALSGKEKRRFDKLVGDVLEAMPAGYMGEAIFRALNLGDKPYRRAPERARLSEIAKIRGLTGIQRDKFINNPDEWSIQEAKKAGDIAVYTNDNAVSDVIKYINRNLHADGDATKKSVKQASMIGKALFKIAKATTLPYVKTPVNLAIEAFEYAVPAYSLGRSLESAYRGNRRQALDYFGKAVVGSMIASAATTLITKGIITGSPSEDQKTKQAEFTGKEGYRMNIDAFQRYLSGGSPEWQDGDNTVTLKGYGTLSMIMMAYANAFKDKTPDEVQQMSSVDKWGTVFPSIVTSSLDQSIMTGVNTALQAALKGEKERNAWLNNTALALSTAVYPNTAAAISQTFFDDNYYRETRDLSTKEGVLKKQIVNTFKDRMFMGKDLPTKVSIWGEPVKRIPDGESWTYNLLGISKNKKYQKYTFGVKMFELYESYKKTNPDEAKNIFPMLPSPATKVGWEDSKMTPIELQNYQMRVGSLRAQFAENYINSEEFQSAPIDEQVQTLTSMYSKARKMAEAEQFSWSDFKKEKPEDFKIMLDNEALPLPSMARKMFDVKMEPSDIKEYNDIALRYYAEEAVPFLKSLTPRDIKDMKVVDPETGKSEWAVQFNAIWHGALNEARGDMESQLLDKPAKVSK